MRLVAITLAAAVGAGGCEKKSSSAPSCEQAASHHVDAMLAIARARAKGDVPDEVVAEVQERMQRFERVAPRLKAIMVARCTEDRWPAEAIACYATTASVEDVRNCRAKLPPELEAKLRAQELELQSDSPVRLQQDGPKDPEVARLEAELMQLRQQRNEALKQMQAANDDASRAAASDRIDALRDRILELERKLGY